MEQETPTGPRLFLKIGSQAVCISEAAGNTDDLRSVLRKVVNLINSEPEEVEYNPTFLRPGTALPRSRDDAIQWASMEAVPAWFAERVYHQCEGRGWSDGAGRPITNWRNHVRYRYISSGSPAQPKETQPQQTVWELQTRMEMIEDEIEKITDQERLGSHRYRTADGELTDEWREYLAKLRLELRQIKSALIGIPRPK